MWLFNFKFSIGCPVWDMKLARSVLPRLAPLTVSDLARCYYISLSARVIKFLCAPKIPSRLLCNRERPSVVIPKPMLSTMWLLLMLQTDARGEKVCARTHTPGYHVLWRTKRDLSRCPLFKTKIIKCSHIGKTVGTAAAAGLRFELVWQSALSPADYDQWKHWHTCRYVVEQSFTVFLRGMTLATLIS